MTDTTWILFWLVWAAGGLVVCGEFARKRNRMVHPVPLHWTPLHIALFILGGGPVIWAITLVIVMRGDE